MRETESPHPCTHTDRIAPFLILAKDLDMFCWFVELFCFVSILICTSSSESVTIVYQMGGLQENVLECCINIILWEVKGLRINHCLLIRRWWTSLRRFIGSTKPLAIELRKLVVGSSAQNAKFLNFRKDQHSRQSCQFENVSPMNGT